MKPSSDKTKKLTRGVPAPRYGTLLNLAEHKTKNQYTYEQKTLPNSHKHPCWEPLSNRTASHSLDPEPKSPKLS